MGVETKEIVASNIYYYRKRAKITQEELAGRANAGQKTVSKIENGRQNYSIDTLERLCIELKIPMYRVFTPRDGIGFRELLSDPAYAKGAIMLLYHYYMFMSTCAFFVLLDSVRNSPYFNSSFVIISEQSHAMINSS